VKIKQVLINLAIMLASAIAGLFLCELGSRLFLDPVDYLSPIMVRDDILGIKLPGISGGHDEWGFRNKKVPEAAEIVAIGDSHTYGNAAKMSEAWPHKLAELTGKSVYSLSMGGYGPNQYYYLLKTKALGLKPRLVICGLYMGDDFDNAFRITYGLNYWAFLRGAGLGNTDPDIWEKETKTEVSWHKRIRNWLSGHSIIYKLVINGVLAKIKGRFQVENASKIYPDTTSLILPDKNVREVFWPKAVLRGLDQESPSVKEGMRITFKLLHEMNAICASNHIEFIVAVIPTKESVFSRYLEHNQKVAMSDYIEKVIANEHLARQACFDAMKQDNIPYVDLLPAMEKASEGERLYFYGASDIHPNKNGYRVIAETISKYVATLNR